MNVTGQQIRDALRGLNDIRDARRDALQAALWACGSDVMAVEAAEHAHEVETSIVCLEVAQERYNALVEVQIGGERMPLAWAVKSIGGLTRFETVWRQAARDPRQPRRVPVDACLAEARRWGRLAGDYRSACMLANTTPVGADRIGLDVNLIPDCADQSSSG